MVLRLSSNSLSYREVVSSVYTMASGFEIVDKEYIEELNNKNKNEITKNITEYWRNVFEK